MNLQGLIVMALATGFVADENATKIVGVWTGSIERNDKSIKVTNELSKDGKFKFTFDAEGEVTVKKGTYTATDDKLTLTGILDGQRFVTTYSITELTKNRLVLLDDETKMEITLSKKK